MVIEFGWVVEGGSVTELGVEFAGRAVVSGGRDVRLSDATVFQRHRPVDQ